jgi:hypothetical protein
VPSAAWRESTISKISLDNITLSAGIGVIGFNAADIDASI